MQTISSFQAKTHLAQLLAKAEAGESITITRRGKAVARLGPVPPTESQNLQRLLEEAQQIRQGIHLGDDTPVGIVHSGRKY